MGCVLGRELSANVVAEVKKEKEEKERKDLSVESDRKVDDVNAAEVRIEGTKKEEKLDGSGCSQRPRKERRSRARANPRLSNFSKHVRGEQVAAGWPPWLTDAAGEAINGWIPRRADTFEKIDKVGHFIFKNILLFIYPYIRLSCIL